MLPNEEASDFILRVETERRCLHVSKEVTYYSFMHRLPLQTWVRLETARANKVMLLRSTFEWADVVRGARDE